MTKRELKKFYEIFSVMTDKIGENGVVKFSDDVFEFSPKLDILLEEFLGKKPDMSDYDYNKLWKSKATISEFTSWLGEKISPGKCRTCRNKARKLHTCPYLSEIDGDNETLCNCCSGCESICGREI